MAFVAPAETVAPINGSLVTASVNIPLTPVFWAKVAVDIKNTHRKSCIILFIKMRKITS